MREPGWRVATKHVRAGEASVDAPVLSADVWSEFVERYWEKKPFLIRQPFAGLFATPTEIFQGLMNAGDQYREEGKSESIRFYIEHAALMAEVGKHLPNV